MPPSSSSLPAPPADTPLLVHTPVKQIRRKPKRTYAIPKVAFRRIVQEIAGECGRSDLRIQRKAFDALQESAEQLVTRQFVRCSQLAELCKLDTVRHEHWKFVQDTPGEGALPCLGMN